VRNPHYPEVQEVKCQTAPLKVFGNGVSLYDYVGNAAIAGMLNHPEKYQAVFSTSFFSMSTGVSAEDKDIRLRKMRMYRG
jgi:hypothetical protein